MIDQPYMFDFYDGGGLDIASLSFAEVDAEGNVNVHAFEGRVRGPGGFPNISAKTGRINFVGTLTAKGLEETFDGGVQIVHEGELGKFVPKVREISFNGRLARERGQRVRYITERAVFALEDDGLVLIEVAPGIDVERDVLGQMGFRPRVADDVRRDGPAPLRDGADGPGGRLRGGRVTELVELELGRVARLELVNPPLNLVTQALLEALDAALATLAAAAPGDVRAVVVSGRGDRAFSAGSHVGEFEAQRGPGGRARHVLESGVATPAGRPADADDRGDRGQRAGRRPGARAVLRHPDRLGTRQARPARGAPRGHARRRRDAAAAAGRRRGEGPRADPDRARPDRGRGRADRARQRGRAGRRGRRAGRGPSARRSPRADRSPSARPSDSIDLALDTDIETGLAAELEASIRVFETDDLLEGATAFLAKRDPEYRGR